MKNIFKRNKKGDSEIQISAETPEIKETSQTKDKQEKHKKHEHHELDIKETYELLDHKMEETYKYLDKKFEETYHEVENLTKRQLVWKFLHTSFAGAAVWAFFLNLIIETLGRFTTGTWFSGIQFLFQEPIIFLYNTMIIFATICIASLFKRRLFVFVIASIFWLTIGIVNGVILTNRITPFTVKDLSNLEDGMTIITNYFTTWQIVLIGVAIAVAVGLLVLLFIKGPKKHDKVKWKRNLIAVILVIAATFGTTSFMINTHRVETFFGNLGYAYKDYGVAYCFINTWLNTGISKPDGYSEEMMLDIFNPDELGEDGLMLLESKDVDEQHPNILFLQLESFIDPATINTIEVDGDACTNFRNLVENYPSGQLTVPACGAGTANVEFEVMTGLSVKFFGPGEYPYKSVLTENTTEALGYDLKSLGYSTHAIHNHRGVFYNRNTVFANMGMDTFTSIEYMNNVEKTPKNWAKDDLLVECMLDALNSTESRDMIYTISVQGHGKYPSEEVLKNPKLRVTKAKSEELKWKFEYYVNQIYEMDQFIGRLTETLAEYDEPTVLVMYGDHIPAIEFAEEDLDNGNLYGTEYVIWSNFGLQGADEDMYTYQLAAHVLEMLDMKVGTVFTYQQNHKNSETYLTDLKAIGYDMLYGDYYIYGGKNPFEPTDMKMGVKEIKIDEVIKIGDKYYIKGQNFNEYSKVTLDGKTLKTIYLGTNILGLLEEVDPEDAPNMKVSQVETKTKEIMSTTE